MNSFSARRQADIVISDNRVQDYFKLSALSDRRKKTGIMKKFDITFLNETIKRNEKNVGEECYGI